MPSGLEALAPLHAGTLLLTKPGTMSKTGRASAFGGRLTTETISQHP